MKSFVPYFAKRLFELTVIRQLTYLLGGLAAFVVMFTVVASTAVAQGPWITGYYSANNGNLPISQIPWAKYTQVIHFAASTDGSGNVIPYYLNQSEIDLLTRSNPPGTKVLVAIKDNDNNNNYFGQSTAPATIAAFVQSIAQFVTSNGYDGVDFDWEKNVNITQYDDLLSRVRAAMPDKIITMAGNGNNFQAAKDSHLNLDQVNVMCYDLDWGNSESWYVGALWQGSDGQLTCDWDVRNFTTPGSNGNFVPNSKIGIGMPYYGRRWLNVTQALQRASWSRTTTFYYRDLVADPTRWVDAYKKWDGAIDQTTGQPIQQQPHGADYLSINTSNLKEFDSYTGTTFLSAAAAWRSFQGFGGFMSFTIEYEHLSTQTCDAAFPLSSALYNDTGSTAGVISVLSATAGNAQVVLGWSACAGAASYSIYRSSGSEGPYNLIAPAIAASSFTDTAVSNGATYYYYITSLDSIGNPVGNSNQVSVTPADLSLLPLPPTNLTATSPAKRQIQISWTAPADATSATTYEIWRSTVSGGPYKYIDTTANTSYANLGMASGTTYYYVVRAKNAAGAYSPYSNEAFATAR